MSGRSALRMHLRQGVNALVDTAVLEEVLARGFSYRSFGRRKSCQSAQECSEADRPEDCDGCGVRRVVQCLVVSRRVVE